MTEENPIKEFEVVKETIHVQYFGPIYARNKGEALSLFYTGAGELKELDGDVKERIWTEEV
jgi:hypothetical protein